MQLLKITLLFISIFIYSCGSKPKVIVEDVASKSNPASAAASPTVPLSAETGAMANDMHQVKALEILQAERYTYMRVTEKSDTFWIASTKMEPKVGNSYFYRGGLLKTNFESVEHKRTFAKIYLVSSIIDASAHPGGNTESDAEAEHVHVNTTEVKKIAGAIKLDALLKSKENYSGKVIIVSGKVVKANYGIMGKNWYHIQDGTKAGGKNADLTITSADNLPMDAIVNFEGKIYLNKDFGAGYKYDIIMEEAKLK
jgi:GW (Gly-Tryp) dipeptide domain